MDVVNRRGFLPKKYTWSFWCQAQVHSKTNTHRAAGALGLTSLNRTCLWLEMARYLVLSTLSSFQRFWQILNGLEAIHWCPDTYFTIAMGWYFEYTATRVYEVSSHLTRTYRLLLLTTHHLLFSYILYACCIIVSECDHETIKSKHTHIYVWTIQTPQNCYPLRFWWPYTYWYLLLIPGTGVQAQKNEIPHGPKTLLTACFFYFVLIYTCCRLSMGIPVLALAQYKTLLGYGDWKY